MVSTVSRVEMKKRAIHKVVRCRYASSVPALLWALEPEAVLVLGWSWGTGNCSTGNKWPLKLGDLLRLAEKTLRAGKVKLKLATEFALCDAPFSGFSSRKGELNSLKCNAGIQNPVLGGEGLAACQMKNTCESIYVLRFLTRSLNCHIITGLTTHILHSSLTFFKSKNKKTKKMCERLLRSTNVFWVTAFQKCPMWNDLRVWD